MTLKRRCNKVFCGDQIIMLSKLQNQINATGKVLPCLHAWMILISKSVTRCILILLAVLASLFLPVQRRIIYLYTSQLLTAKSIFTGCQGDLTFFRFCPPDADAAIINDTEKKARSHQTSDGARLFALQDIPTIKVSELKINQSNERGQSCQEIGRSGAEKSVKKNADMSGSRSIAAGATRSASATKKKSAKNAKRKSNKKKGGNNGSGVRSRVHLSAVSDRVNSRKLINHTRGSK